MTRTFWAAPVVALLGGLVLLVAGGAEWVSGFDVRDVGGVTLRERVGSSGTQYAPLSVAFGLGGLAGGALLAASRSLARRVAGAFVAAVGVGGLAVVVLGLSAAARADGTLTPAPFFAAAAAVALVVAGLAALRGVAAPPSSSRYRVADERPSDDEWALAAGDDDQPT